MGKSLSKLVNSALFERLNSLGAAQIVKHLTIQITNTF